jgi:hypothetical protein
MEIWIWLNTWTYDSEIDILGVFGSSKSAYAAQEAETNFSVKVNSQIMGPFPLNAAEVKEAAA